MAYIPGFKHDIFISYAHVDNSTASEQEKGWIEQFYNYLVIALDKRAGRSGKINIWWDSKKLGGNTVFDTSIETGIRESAIMICLNSQGYHESDYCQKELDTFFSKTKQEDTGLIVGDQSRIFNVLLYNVPFDKWPAELSGTSGFPFHTGKDANDFGDPVDTNSTEFKTQLQKIRDAIWNILNAFPQEQIKNAEQQQTKSEEDKDAFTIYLGEVADTLRTPRKRIISELEKKGFKVVTGAPPPDEAAAHEKATNEALKNSNLVINLLDELPGREIAGDPDNCYPQKQTELALKSGKSQMIWVPTEVDFSIIEEEKYKLFLQGLETGKTSSKAYEFVRGSKSTLAKEIIDFAEQVKAQQMQKKAEKGKISVLLDTHLSDQLYALDLSKALLENKIQPFINPQEDDPRKNINLMSDRLSQVNKLIFLYGTVSKEWVLERMSAALQLIITNNYPIEDFFIYMAPPYKEAGNISINQRFLKVNVIDNSKKTSMNKEDIQQFLNALNAGAA